MSEELKAQTEPVQKADTDAQKATPAEKMLTQEEHDKITKARIDKQNAKHAQELEELKNKLSEQIATREALEEEAAKLKREKELQVLAEDISKTTGVPASVLRGSTKEELEAHAEQLKPVIAPSYPVVTSDKGETKVPAPTKESILTIADERERKAAIAANIELWR